MTAHVRAEDMRQLLRLVGECREIRDAGEHPSLHFLRGLARLTRSQIVIHMNASGVRDGATPTIDDVQDVGWSNDSDRRRVYQFVALTRVDGDPLTAAIFKKRGRIVTMARADVVSAGAWRRTEVRNDVHRASGIDDSLLSMCRKPRPGEVRVLAFKRAWGEAPYEEEIRELVDVAHGECAWLLEGGRAANNAFDGEWTPREKETLDLLLTGGSEKTVASALGLSPHTVHDYVKVIYRKLGVTSRAELMARALATGPVKAR